MLEWKIKDGDTKLKNEIAKLKDTFDSWFNPHWSKTCSREKMLSDESPVLHVYYQMTKSLEEIKEAYPLSAMQLCSSCGNYVGKWVETKFSFCNEYDCGISLCKECLDNKIKRIEL